MLALTIGLVFFGVRQDGALLAHTFHKGEKDQYTVHSHLQSQERNKGLETWIPADFDLEYKFTNEVVDMLPDGVAKIHYLRPSLSLIYGETYDTPAHTEVEKVAFDFMLQVSQANEILATDDLGKKGGQYRFSSSPEPIRRQEDAIAHYLQELIRMSVFVSSFDTSLDFSPKLALNPVKVGDTWKRTISYEPQQLKGRTGQVAVQRIDYTYTYAGLEQNESGKQVCVVNAKASFNSDLAAYLNQFAESDTGLLKLPVRLDASIKFSLDPKSLKLLQADAESEGGFQVFLSSDPDSPQHETTLKGATTVRLVGTRK